MKRQRFEFDIDDYTLIHEIGSGGFATAYLVKNNNTKKEAAIKTIKDTASSSKNVEKYRQKINREIVILIRCQHPTIIKFLGYSFKDLLKQNNFTIFMEYMKNGSLTSILEKSRENPVDHFDNTAKQIILIGIARAMMYLHQHKIVHRDLKPGNVLLDEYLHPHITDFGLSKIFQDASKMSQTYEMGTLIYMAPEVINGESITNKIDVYAFGILMYEVVTNRFPYSNLEEKELTPYKFHNKIIKNNIRPVFDKNDQINDALKNLIEKCGLKNQKKGQILKAYLKNWLTIWMMIQT